MPVRQRGGREAHERPVLRRVAVCVTQKRLPRGLEATKRGARRDADVEAAAGAGKLALPVPAYVALELVDRAEYNLSGTDPLGHHYALTPLGSSCHGRPGGSTPEESACHPHPRR